ncbi:MAG: DNA-directed RNA polymerase [Candidatus Aenigmarchaeota archaeon]|nr:DNA-directed RNA polymerase [Candidatus Aenigmarchaeota archaeon]MDW8148984.1 DNA-directed RNA polymerase [Candidatus Aenigmarchaeota archaeon]
MFRIVSVEENVKVHPSKFGKNIKKAIEESINESIVDKIDKKFGVILSLIKINEIGEGKIYPADPHIYYRVIFDVLTYKPEINEIAYGEVIDNVRFGSFIRIVCFDSLVHISQSMDDFVSFNEKTKTFDGKETKRKLKIGDLVRARIISVSYEENNLKIGCTMRQPFLGTLEWIKEDRKKHAKKS